MWEANEIGDDNGMLRFEAVDEPFEFTVLPYNESQLEEARHREELPKPYYTFVKIMAKQMGVGGDDSWGAPVHEQYRIHGNERITLHFVIKPAK